MMMSVPSCFIDKHYYFASILITRALLPSDCSAAAVSPGTLSLIAMFHLLSHLAASGHHNTPHTPGGEFPIH